MNDNTTHIVIVYLDEEPASFFESDSVSLWGLLGFDLLWV